MPEKLTFTAPPSVTDIHASTVTLCLDDVRVIVELKDNNGKLTILNYTGVKATNILHVINTSDNTTISAIKRLYNFLVADGVLSAGTVSGTPD